MNHPTMSMLLGAGMLACGAICAAESAPSAVPEKTAVQAVQACSHQDGKGGCNHKDAKAGCDHKDGKGGCDHKDGKGNCGSKPAVPAPAPAAAPAGK